MSAKLVLLCLDWMLLSEAQAHHKKFPVTKASIFSVPWSQTEIKFSETLQIIDAHDCMQAVYGSKESATAAQNKHLGNAGVDATAASLGYEREKLRYKVKWDVCARTRNAIPVPAMKKLLEDYCSTMPMSKELAKLIDMEPLTLQGVYENLEKSRNASFMHSGSSVVPPQTSTEAGDMEEIDTGNQTGKTLPYTMYPNDSTVLSLAWAKADQQLARQASTNIVMYQASLRLQEAQIRTVELTKSGATNIATSKSELEMIDLEYSAKKRKLERDEEAEKRKLERDELKEMIAYAQSQGDDEVVQRYKKRLYSLL